MITFKKIEMQNFLSYGNYVTSINLNRPEATLITGINYDSSVNGELDSNGSGKSSILNAISFACYNKAISIDGGKKDTLINNINKKDMFVRCTLDSNKKLYVITRYRKNKAMGGDGVKIELKTGKELKDITPDSVANADKFISETIIGIPFEIFNKIVAYAAGEEAFLKQPLAKQREVIEELFSYTELSKKADILKENIKGHKKDLEYAKESNQSIIEESERHQSQLDDMLEKEKEWENSNKEKKLHIKEEIAKLEKIDFDSELEKVKSINETMRVIREIKSEIKLIENNIKRFEDEQEKYEGYDEKKAEKLAKLHNNLASLEEISIDPNEQRELFSSLASLHESVSEREHVLSSKESTIKSVAKDISNLEKELSHLDDDKCPYCLQKYADAQTKIKEIKKKLSNLNKELSSTEEDKLELENFIKEKELEIREKENLLIFKKESELDRYLAKVEETKANILRVEAEENPYSDNTKNISDSNKELKSLRKSLNEKTVEVESNSNELLFDNESELYEQKSYYNSLLKSKDDEDVNPYTDIIDRLKEYKPKKSKSKEIDDLIETIKHEEFLLKLLTKKDSFIRKALMDKYLPFLNERLRHYLNMMSLPHKVAFTSDLSTRISQFGEEIPYTALSAGQKARVNIALSLSFRDVLQSRHNFINLFILDECLDVGLSNVGVRKTVKAIKEVAKTNKLSMFVISHRDEVKSSFPATLSVEMKNGFSKVV